MATHPDVPPRIATYLNNAVQNHRLGHALLFLGEKSSQKERTALQFAAGLLCHNRQNLPSSGFGCGSCMSCEQALQNKHIHIQLIMSEAEQVRRKQERESSSTSSPSEEIRIDAIRKLNHEQRMRNLQNGPQIWIIVDGHRLTIQAANALLKTLEEPQNDQFIIVLAPSLRSVLPTIASRCQRLVFPVEPNGRDFDVSATNIPTLVSSIQDGTLLSRLQLIETLAKNRDETLATLAGIQSFLMHALKAIINGDKSHLSLDRVRMRLLLVSLEKAQVAINSHMNTQLVLEDLFLKTWPLS